MVSQAASTIGDLLLWPLTSRKPQAARTTRRASSSTRPRLEALEDRCLLSGAGSLDPTFGGTGIVTTSFPKCTDQHAYAGLIQPWDGKLIAVGWAAISQLVIALARYNPDGSLDPLFGSGGKANSPGIFSAGSASAALYPHSNTANDGQIVVGSRQNLFRFNPNGSLDKSFGTPGKGVKLPWPIADEHGVVIQADGKIIVGGTELTRFNANGTVDTSFGSGGTVAQGANALQLQADGKLLISTGGGLARFNTNGNLDITFNSAGPVPGTVTTSIGVNCLAIYSGSGQIVAASGGGVARFNADGTPDTTFGLSGQVTTSFPNGAWVNATAVQADGKILVAGGTGDGSGYYHSSLWRYTTVGSLDATFGTGGLVQSSSVEQVWNDLALRADGRVVTVGYTHTPHTGNYDFLLARYLNEPLIGALSASPNPVTAGSVVTLTASGVTGSGTITQVAFYVQQGSTNTLLGYGTQTSPGVWTYTFTVNLAHGTYTLIAVAEDSYGLYSDPFALTLTVQ
jgi:uncharacterized delta-60 repeat protein